MKINLINLFLAFAALVALGLSALTASAPPGSGKIEGVVTDESRRPLKGVGVGIDKTTAQGPIQEILPVTNDEGRFLWTDLPPGTYTLRAVKEGYRPQTFTVEVRDGETAKVEVVLPPAGS
jgi:hypothetical protein